MAGKIPGPYVRSTEQDNSVVVYPNGGDFAKMGIGARSSGLPESASSGPKPIEHVGGSQGGGGTNKP